MSSSNFIAPSTPFRPFLSQRRVTAQPNDFVALRVERERESARALAYLLEARDETATEVEAHETIDPADGGATEKSAGRRQRARRRASRRPMVARRGHPDDDLLPASAPTCATTMGSTVDDEAHPRR